MIDKHKQTTQIRSDLRALLADVFPARARAQTIICLVVFVLIDLAVWALCPQLGGNCFYGFFTLIAYPVMLSGIFGVLLPRFALHYRRHWGARMAILAAGLLVLAATILAAHSLAIYLLNADAYGGLLVRPRLLTVELSLAIVYYVTLGTIVVVKFDHRAG